MKVHYRIREATMMELEERGERGLVQMREKAARRMTERTPTKGNNLKENDDRRHDAHIDKDNCSVISTVALEEVRHNMR
jgi:hypothetical protein